MKDVRQIVFDTETTGFEFANGDRLVEFGAIEVINRKKTGRVLYFCVDPEMEVPQEAFDVHGWNRENLIRESRKGFPNPDSDVGIKFAERAQEVYEFFKGAELIAHNAKFDIKFIDGEMGRAGIYHAEGIEKISDVCTIRDTLKMAQDIFPGQRVNLNALCKKYDIVNTDRELHGALIDSELLLKVYLRMTQNQATLDFDNEGEKKKAKVNSGRIAIDVQLVSSELSNKLPKLKLSEESMGEHKKISKRISKESGEDYNWGF